MQATEMLKGRYYPETMFGGFTRVDGTVAFYERVNSLITPRSMVVDFGCGRGVAAEDDVLFRRNIRTLRGRAGLVIGIDVDAAGKENPLIDEFRLLEGAHWPVESCSVDLIVADYVLEHIACPEDFFAEAYRVLGVGGHLCIRTPNAWSCVGIISRLIPSRHHSRVLAVAQRNRQTRDVFPTVYACNSARRISREMSSAGFHSVVMCHEAEPAYLDFSPALYGLFTVLRAITPPLFRSQLLAFGRKVDYSARPVNVR